MKKILFLSAVLALTALSLFAQTKKDGTPDMRYKANRQTQVNTYTVPSTNTSVRYQRGYIKENGTYVQPHYKTKENNTNHDNFSTSGNTNIYTGESGSRAKDYSPEATNYGSGKTIQTGSRGGQYYINSKGKKTYVPKR
ncbi:MAG: hypothetical protein HXX14_01785 [Bacteroidetes bacterium]|nr:hypothetical protein [Bacteroidota bacterium]